ncbi:PK1L2-like protein [Mya arenaria]|uniref:PK1L2-like protein n=1 Tax=Mya arenaria TaxID=6604 RepID=A0ABY7EAG6_MYAAR|nr:PK1L2-like protein [Mya arenaria]
MYPRCGGLFQYMYTKKNPYSWKESVAIVTSGVQSLTLKDSHNKPVHMNNLKSPLKLAFDFDDIELINAVYGRGNGDGGNVLDNITRYCQECDHRCCKDNTASCIGIYAGCGMFCSHLPDISMTANCTDLNEDLTAKDTPGNVISGKTIYLSAREPKLEESNVTSYVLYFTVSVDLTDTQTREELMLREQGCLGNETFSECYALMDLTTTLRSFHLGCYYWDVEKDDWTQEGMQDVESGSSWNYIYNDWLAVDMGSLLSTTATIEATSEDQMRMKQKYRFMIQSSREIRDGHLWISIFSKPPASQFTRVQRLTCALSLLLSTMLTNLMFYGIPTDEPTDQE